ncbi:hypothetical protein AVEN_171012-1 [Araneus ventricosus]|uniref:Uncharacterized protein n=1 Tax=Araneus ventricosus TaxID=182803 RepID=A0A4Y2MFE2_ARAVE|nr:hypothetical protein AVEN_49505-1 [Araneus ventricosus]GBN25182.1 hypothetical protein AVEN_171012-1 [Araneus ventricosus]
MVYGASLMSRKQVRKHDFLSRKQVCRNVEYVHDRDIGTEILESDLAPSDFELFGPLKKNPAGPHFRTDVEFQEAFIKWLRDLDSDFFYAGFDRLVYRCHKCFKNHDDYVQK